MDGLIRHYLVGSIYRAFYPVNLTKSLKAQSKSNSHISMASTTFEKYQQPKLVWVWTRSKQVMTTAVERGWNTFVFPSGDRQIADEWCSIALIHPLFIEAGKLFDKQNKTVASFCEISSPQQLQQLQPHLEQAENVVLSFLDWQVIPAENIVAAFQGSQKTVFAVAKSPSEAQIFLEALEQGLGGVILKAEDAEDVLTLKDYFDRRDDSRNQLNMTKATVTRVEIAGMGDRGPVHAYVAVPGGKTCYLSELQAGNEVIVVDQAGFQRTAVVGRVKIESRPLILVEAMVFNRAVSGYVKIERWPLILVEAMNSSDYTTNYSIFLQNAETVGLVCPCEGNEATKTAIPVTSLDVGEEVLLRVQGGARHTGIEIEEFIVEK
ncbi:hypothetical protein ACLOJK_013089 [Asimina triloba]